MVILTRYLNLLKSLLIIYSTLSIILSLNIEFEKQIFESRAGWEKYRINFLSEEEEDAESNSTDSREYFK
jgi:hypothetical protein